ncbi:MAG TPA: hypothetical protein VFS60_03425 [Thermoanaerobaculia bacterium]|nr:hypothetical protein [Thermoanaerobaculia bacterium]
MKLVISLATGTIAFTVTFSEKFGGVVPRSGLETALVAFGWGFLLASVGFGIWALLALVDSASRATATGAAPPDVRSRRIRVPFQLQLLAFGWGEAAIVLYGLCRLS